MAMKQSWPSIMRTLYGDHKRYEETYFSAYKVAKASHMHSGFCRVQPHVVE